jgi:hypothetical protein
MDNERIRVFMNKAYAIGAQAPGRNQATTPVDAAGQFDRFRSEHPAARPCV